MDKGRRAVVLSTFYTRNCRGQLSQGIVELPIAKYRYYHIPVTKHMIQSYILFVFVILDLMNHINFATSCSSSDPAETDHVAGAISIQPACLGETINKNYFRSAD